MIRKSTLFFFPVLILFLSGCQRSINSEQSRFYEDGQLKPAIVLIPVIDSSGQELSWSLSEELTEAIAYKLTGRGQLFIVDQSKAKLVFSQLNSSHNPFSSQIDWIKNACTGQDFAIFMELIEHEEVPITTQQDAEPSQCPAQLNISLRVRVIDLRSEAPQVILQEILHDRHHIPRPFTKSHFHQVPWGKESFSISPVGLAHAQLVKEVSLRIEEYILETVLRNEMTLFNHIIR
jgi:hypothetical protein